MVFSYKNNDYEVVVVRKNNKNIYIRVKDDNKVYVTCPLLYTNMMVKKLLADNYSAVVRMLLKLAKKDVKKKENPNTYLGYPIDVVFCNTTSNPVLIDNKLFVKDKISLDRWYKKKALSVFEEHLDHQYHNFKETIPYPKLKIRQMKTRWGVNNRRDNSVTLNLQLIKMDSKYLDYVIIHELSHFLYFNHGEKFWDEVSKYCKDYKLMRKEMRDDGD